MMMTLSIKTEELIRALDASFKCLGAEGVVHFTYSPRMPHMVEVMHVAGYKVMVSWPFADELKEPKTVTCSMYARDAMDILSLLLEWSIPEVLLDIEPECVTLRAHATRSFMAAAGIVHDAWEVRSMLEDFRPQHQRTVPLPEATAWCRCVKNVLQRIELPYCAAYLSHAVLDSASVIIHARNHAIASVKIASPPPIPDISENEARIGTILPLLQFLGVVSRMGKEKSLVSEATPSACRWRATRMALVMPWELGPRDLGGDGHGLRCDLRKLVAIMNRTREMFPVGPTLTLAGRHGFLVLTARGPGGAVEWTLPASGEGEIEELRVRTVRTVTLDILVRASDKTGEVKILPEGMATAKVVVSGLPVSVTVGLGHR